MNRPDEDENDYTPNTPAVNEDTKKGKDDPNEFLLGDDEIIDEELDSAEDYHED